MEYVPFGAKDKIKLTIAIVMDIICTPTKTGKKCTEKDAIKFMMMCQAKALNPFEGDAFLIGYDGREGPVFSLITAHQAFLKRAELHPEYDGMESGIIIKSEDGTLSEREGDFFETEESIVGGWARVHFKNRKHPMYKRIRMTRFKKGFGIWQEDDAGMICKCAEADALRSSFPTMLGGLYLKEETHREDDTKMATPVFESKSIDVPIQKRIIDVPKEEPAKQEQPDPKAILIALIKKDGITIPNLIGAMESAALAKGDETSIDDLDPDSIAAAIEHWDRFVQMIKEVCK